MFLRRNRQKYINRSVKCARSMLPIQKALLSMYVCALSITISITQVMAVNLFCLLHGLLLIFFEIM